MIRRAAQGQDQRPIGLPRLDGVTSVAELAQRLAPYFLSSSLGTAPKATGGKGGRSVASLNVPASDQTFQSLQNGTLTWRFKTPFSKPPLIGITPEGTPPTSSGVPAVLYIKSRAANAVIIASTIATDSRLLHLTATEDTNS